jgi:twinkle protein
MSKAQQLMSLGIPLKKFSGTTKTICPKCSHTRKKKTDPCLSVDVDNGLYHCHNCDWKGGVSAKPERTYTMPTFNKNHTNLPDKVVDWFKGRGIRQQTLLEWKIGYQEEWMPQANAKCRVIAFNYFLGGTLINQKFRTADKHFKMVKDAKLIMYGLDNIREVNDPVVICEGEIDALSIYQSGHTQVLSVPNGASKGAQLEYIDNSLDQLDPVKMFIIWTDNDDAGLALRKELIRRLGEERCKIVKSELKDANEVLIKHGETEINRLIESATPAKLSGIVYTSDMNDEILSLYENGMPKGDATGTELDRLITWEKCRLTMVTGIPSHGKSEFIDFILGRLVCFKSWRVGYYSPENYPRALHVSKIIEKIIGKSFRSGNNISRMNELELRTAQQYMEDRYFFINPDNEDFSVDSILEHAKKLVRRHGVNAIVIDPYNKLEHNLQRGENETAYISKLLDKIIMFCQNNQCHVFLIAHPTKMRKKEDGTFEVPTMYDISGSAHFYNKTDNGLTVYRDFDSGRVSVHVQKVKFKHIGQAGVQEFFYSLQSGRYYNAGEDQTNWINLPEQSALSANTNFLNTTTDDEPFPF